MSFTPSQTLGRFVPASDYKLSGPYAHANLAVYLVHAPDTDGGAVVPLAEALAAGIAVVAETGDVNRLTVENLSTDTAVFVQAGDIVKGGKQDRTLPVDAVIGRQSGPVPIDSFCVEQGRWRSRGKEDVTKFETTTHTLSTSDMKRAARDTATQHEVWASVARTQQKLAARTGKSVHAAESHSSLQLTLETPAVKDAVAPFTDALKAVPAGDAVGVVVAVNGKPTAAEVYASRRVFAALWPKLAEGAAVEAVAEDDGAAASPPEEGVVRQFLLDAESAPPSEETVTASTYVLVRKGTGVTLFDSCDRGNGNLVVHRSVLAG